MTKKCDDYEKDRTEKKKLTKNLRRKVSSSYNSDAEQLKSDVKNHTLLSPCSQYSSKTRGKYRQSKSGLFELWKIFFFFQGNYHREQYFTGKFVISFSYKKFASLIFCFDLNSTKILSTYHFIFLSQFSPYF